MALHGSCGCVSRGGHLRCSFRDLHLSARPGGIFQPTLQLNLPLSNRRITIAIKSQRVTRSTFCMSCLDALHLGRHLRSRKHYTTTLPNWSDTLAVPIQRRSSSSRSKPSNRGGSVHVLVRPTLDHLAKVDWLFLRIHLPIVCINFQGKRCKMFKNILAVIGEIGRAHV